MLDTEDAPDTVEVAAMPRSAETSQITFRAPTSWLADFDAIAAKLSRPGLDLSRSDAVRLAVARGLEGFRAELALPVAEVASAKASKRTKTRKV